VGVVLVFEILRLAAVVAEILWLVAVAFKISGAM
jgi:hypothetical protein